MPSVRPLWWTYTPGIYDETTRRDVVIRVGPLNPSFAEVRLENANRAEIATAGQALFELEQIRYESEGGE